MKGRFRREHTQHAMQHANWAVETFELGEGGGWSPTHPLTPAQT
jgi:hypothetical protein